MRRGHWLEWVREPVEGAATVEELSERIVFGVALINNLFGQI